jgi:putative ABC transport system substrate-binding protein
LRRPRSRGVAIALPLALTVIALAASSAAADVPRVGLLWQDGPADVRPVEQAFLRGLHDHGWVPGQDVLVEQRWAEGHPERLVELARELVRLRVAVIVTSNLIGVQAAQQVTRTIPIVFATMSDPFGAGVVGSAGHPASNATGLTVAMEQLGAQRVELLKETLPAVRHVAVLWNSVNRGVVPIVKETETTARRLGMSVTVHDVRRARHLEEAFLAFERDRPDALIVLPDPLFTTLRARLLELTERARLPAMFARREYAEGGGLMSYGPNYVELFQRSASFVDRILRGVPASQLPVERPTRFELVINLRTARTLGIAIPDAVLGRAEVIR